MDSAMAAMRARRAVICTGLCIAAAVGRATAAEQPADETAVWTPKESHFLYQGFTAEYSCDGLRDKMRRVLLVLGAREDLKLQSSCSTPSGPDPFPGVWIKMNVLQPAPQASSAAGGTVAAHWQSVNLVLERDPLAAATDCELVEQVKTHVLPLFTVRNVRFHSACVPHQPQIGGTELRAEVLMADSERAAPAAAR